MEDNQVSQLQKEVSELRTIVSELRITTIEQSKTIDRLSTTVEVQHQKITSLEVSRGTTDTKIDNLIDIVNSLKKDVNESLEKLSGKVETLNNKPGERWNSLIGSFLIAIGSAIATIVVAKFTGVKM